MGLDGKWAHDERKPSSEFKIHLDLYKNRCVLRRSCTADGCEKP